MYAYNLKYALKVIFHDFLHVYVSWSQLVTSGHRDIQGTSINARVYADNLNYVLKVIFHGFLHVYISWSPLITAESANVLQRIATSFSSTRARPIAGNGAA